MGATRRAEGTRLGSKVRAEPPWNLILHNDANPINRVVWRNLPGISMKRTTRVTWEAHAKGRAEAKSCYEELAELYEDRLRAKGLTASIEPAH